MQAAVRPFSSSRWVAAGVTLAVWALAAGSALFWYLRAGSANVPTGVQAAGNPASAVPVDTRAVARTLGAPDATASTQAAPDVTSRLALRGVVTHGGRGAALISIDGKPPAKPLRVGAELEGVEGGWAVRSVSQRTVVIAAGGREARLEMPALELRSTKGDAVAPPRPAVPAAAPQTAGQIAPLVQPPAAMAPSSQNQNVPNQNVPNPPGVLQPTVGGVPVAPATAPGAAPSPAPSPTPSVPPTRPGAGGGGIR